METQQDIVLQVRDWAIDKIVKLHDSDRHRNAKALLDEFDEWLDASQKGEDIEYLYVENCIDIDN